MNLGTRLQTLERRCPPPQAASGGGHVATLCDRLANIAARIAANGGIADPLRCSFADLCAVYLCGDGGSEADRVELTVRLLRVVAEDPERAGFARAVLAAGGVAA